MLHNTFWRGLNAFIFLLVILICLNQIQCGAAERSAETSTRSSRRGNGDSSKSDDSNGYSGDDNKRGRNSRRDGSDDSSENSKKYKDKKKSDNKYGQDMVGDYSGGRDRYDRSRERYSHNKGIDPDTYGQDLADRKDIYEDKDLMVASIHVWIRNADDWDRPDKYPYRPNRYNKNRYGKDSKDKKYSKDKNYKKKDNDYKDKDDDYKGKDKDYKGKDKDYRGKDKDYKKKDDRYNGKDSDSGDDYKKKDKYKKVTFPVRVYKSYKKYPKQRLPTLFNALPWTPIFYDKLTYQTFIYCPTGHFLILPPLINFFGQRFAVAQLIKWGYASLISTGIAPGPGFDALPLVQQPGAPGAPTPPKIPYDPKSGQYNGGVPTNYGSFKPQGY